MKPIKLLYWLAQISASIWFGFHMHSAWQGYVFFCVWETSVMLAFFFAFLSRETLSK